MRDYGLMPWQTGDLTDGEWRALLDDMDARMKAARRQARQRRR
jgi:hypothetical protein